MRAALPSPRRSTTVRGRLQKTLLVEQNPATEIRRTAHKVILSFLYYPANTAAAPLVILSLVLLSGSHLFMNLKGSIHQRSDGIGYGAFISTDRAYYSTAGEGTPLQQSRGIRARARPSSEMIRAYRRNNVTAGIDTHRSDLSYGRATDSVCAGANGDPRAREATKSLTSGEVRKNKESVRMPRGSMRETGLENLRVAMPFCVILVY